MKVLSISVAAYNAEQYLKRCLNSFLIPEILSDLEIIVVDDGATDTSYDIAKQYEEAYPGTFIAVHKSNGGHGSTINTSASVATGKYFKIVDADDWVKSDGLVELVDQLKNTNADLVLNPYVTVVENTEEENQVFPFFDYKQNLHSYCDMDLESISNNLTLPMHSITFKTKLITDSHYKITEHCFYVDSEYTSYYFKDVRTVRYIPTTLYCYRIGANEQSVSFQSMQKRRSEHLTVCEHLYNYYLNEKDALHSANKTVIYRRLVDILNAEYKILLTLPDKSQSLDELKNVINKFDNISKKLLKSTLIDGTKLGYSYTKVVKYLCNNNFRFFGLVHYICKTKSSSK